MECDDPRCTEVPTLGYHDFALFVKCQELVKGTDVDIVVCEECFLVMTPLSKNMLVKQVTTLYGYLRGFLEGRANEKEGSKVVDVKLQTTVQNLGGGKGKGKKPFTKTSRHTMKMTKRQLGPWAGTHAELDKIIAEGKK